MIFQAIAMTGFALYAASRIRFAPGAFTIFYVVGNTAAAAAFTNQSALLATTIVQSLVAGIVADLFVAWRDPQPDNPIAYRIFAVSVPLAPPPTMTTSSVMRSTTLAERCFVQQPAHPTVVRCRASRPHTIHRVEHTGRVR